MTEFRSKALIALGGNLPSAAGEPKSTLVAAIAELSRRGLYVQLLSRFFRTPCFPAGAGPDYVNAVIQVKTDIPSADLLAILHEVEAKFARVRDQRWGMRTLDLDLIARDDQVSPDLRTYKHWQNLPPDEQVRQAPKQLILPHPRLQDRGFVLVPLCDIAPNWVHPVLGVSAMEMLAALPKGSVAEVQPL
ncbi:2-amino-4-hydroxy-6-hydroxymethyldihydropteridine diphosphokinase [Sedimentitalea sp. CY04]|uniref:2-amino-4-hydroxy-6-hydroxymethyldihydropteridine pyrophosphokinase n=1 Tax=Parasedimentitalea denitrificans TaxID=2211118 RepID=A0ABX0WCS9_9RHOB|nr:2-amino-4-hydroxy-6-hydroxymethyldihydropteridine diphosphokinase [Sedimentitalea sp. CY04]NIZ62495.1 2-amino-4-hydroxy-6-hydroxymethyldihydropteridine diphosphokinase [Sedimentitalea sp. CY04]